MTFDITHGSHHKQLRPVSERKPHLPVGRFGPYPSDEIRYLVHWPTVYAPRHRAEWLAKIPQPRVRLRAERLTFRAEPTQRKSFHENLALVAVQRTDTHIAWAITRPVFTSNLAFESPHPGVPKGVPKPSCVKPEVEYKQIIMTAKVTNMSLSLIMLLLSSHQNGSLLLSARMLGKLPRTRRAG